MRQLLKLLNDNRKVGTFQAKSSEDEATVYLYDVIVSDALEAEFWGGVDPLNFAKTLTAIDAPVINLRINSPGGDVFAAQAMAQAIREHPAKVVARIDGYAASAATVVAAAADETIMASGAMYMIHKAWTIAFGNTDDMLHIAELLEKTDATLAEAYAARTGKSIETVKEWMAAETWFSAAEAVEAGFADSVAEAAVKNSAKWNLSAYAKPPAVIAAEVVAPIRTYNTEHLRRMAALVERS